MESCKKINNWSVLADKKGFELCVKRLYERLDSELKLNPAEWETRQLILDMIYCKCYRCSFTYGRIQYCFGRRYMAYKFLYHYIDDLLRWAGYCHDWYAEIPGVVPDECHIYESLKSLKKRIPQHSGEFFIRDKVYTSKP